MMPNAQTYADIADVVRTCMANGHWSCRAQWWVRNTPGHEAIMTLGLTGRWIYINRHRDGAIIKHSSQPEADSLYFQKYTMNAVMRRISNGAS